MNFVYVPAMFGGTWDDYARAFYAAQTLGVQEKTHEALYAAKRTGRDRVVSWNNELPRHPAASLVATP